MQRLVVYFAACAVCMIALGCQQQEVKTDHSQDEAKGYVDSMMNIRKDSQENITEAVQKQNEKNTDAMNVLDENANNNPSTAQTMQNIPKEIDMSLAQTCLGATVKTNKGDITLSFYNDLAPVTVANFCTLAKKGFYDGVIFHRVIKDFMIQGGDPDGTGMGGPGYKFADEIHAKNKNDVGTIAMANAGPGTNGSQFFINTKDNNFLDTKHTVFGKVTSGMEVVTAIEGVETGSMDRPVQPVTITNVLLKM